jgi:WD40 repeat protein
VRRSCSVCWRAWPQSKRLGGSGGRSVRSIAGWRGGGSGCCAGWPAIQVEPPRPAMFKAEPALDGQAFSLGISPDGRALAAGCSDGSVHLLDARTGAKRFSLAGVTRGYVRELGFTPDGKALVGLCDDNQIRLWEATSGKLMKAQPALDDLERVGLPRILPSTLAISPDGGSLFCCDSTATTRIDARTGQTRQDLMRATEGRPR